MNPSPGRLSGHGVDLSLPGLVSLGQTSFSDAEWSSSFQVELSEAGFALAVEFARRYSLTGADSVHLATAQIFTTQLMSLGNGDELFFWTSDVKLARETRSCGLTVKDPTRPTN